jgi:hypothetical protein
MANLGREFDYGEGKERRRHHEPQRRPAGHSNWREEQRHHAWRGGQIGIQMGNHSTEHSGSLPTDKILEPRATPGRPSQMLGNQKALDVGGGGPGKGRTVYKPGFQGTHGPVNRGSAPPPRDILSEFGPEKRRS